MSETTPLFQGDDPMIPRHGRVLRAAISPDIQFEDGILAEAGGASEQFQAAETGDCVVDDFMGMRTVQALHAITAARRATSGLNGQPPTHSRNNRPARRAGLRVTHNLEDGEDEGNPDEV